MQSDKFFIATDSCEFCAEEYVKTEMDKIKHLPRNGKKSAKMNKIMVDAQKVSVKPCVRIQCREVAYENIAYHNICSDHLYKLIDAIKEHEENIAEEK